MFIIIAKMSNYGHYALASVIMLTVNFITFDALQFLLHPDRGLTITQIVRKHGYPVETHSVTTEDGYILTIFRIPHGKNSTRPNKHPVMMVPGTTGCSENFIVSGPDKAIAYYLADRDLDVWLTNTRGNRHARKHTTLNPNNSKAFWNFGWHEVAIYDTPALVDYILKVTNQTSLFYIGHSQGSTTYLAFSAEKPEYNEKIRVAALLAPSCFLGDIKSAVKILGKHSSLIESITSLFQIYEIFPNEYNDIVNFISKTICAETSVMLDICNAILHFGDYSTEIEPITTQLVFETSPARCSVKELVHYFQIVYSGIFRQYDYGSNGNWRNYNASTPPLYNLSNVLTPVGLFYAQSDNLVPIKGVRKLARTLPNIALAYEVPSDNYNHVDYIFGRNNTDLVYAPMYHLFKKYLKKSKLN